MAVGVKTTFTLQVALTAKVAPQLFVAAKSPLAAMLVIVMSPSPVFVRVNC